MIPAKEIDGELWIKAADLPVCPTCEYHKQRAQIWRDEVYRLVGHPLPEREKDGVCKKCKDGCPACDARRIPNDLL